MNKKQIKDKKTTLVLGGTGKTGSRIVQRLRERKWPLRIGSRSGHPPFDWKDQATWKPALKDMKAVYIAFQPDLAVPGAVDSIRSFVETALESGVRKFVLLSGRGEEGAQKCEDVVMASGAEWTIVRASWFNQNFSESYLLEPVLAGHMALPSGNVKEPFIDAGDIADVAEVALTEEGHAGQCYEVTGPRLMTFAEAIGEIADATGREIRYESVSMDQYKAILTEQHVPEEYVWFLTYLFSEVLDGRNAHLSNGVQRALGREPRDFADYAQETAGTGVWDQK